MDLFKDVSQFESKNGQVSKNLSSVKIIGIYFSAHWCPPCRGFTPVLAEFYNKVNETEKVFEVVFLSSDKEQESYQNYLSTMPWVALPLNHYLKAELAKKFQVSGIPRLVILSQSGDVIEDNARTSVANQGVQAFFNWQNSTSKENKSKYTEGLIVSVSSHEHPIKFLSSKNKNHPSYLQGFNCDMCGEFYNGNTLNFHCGTCSYDLCENCYDKDKKEELPNNQDNMNMCNSQEIQLFSNALHEHPLKYVSAGEKNSSVYLGGFHCDECKNFYDGSAKNYFCTKCGYDLCENCYRSNK